jgi:hypothetical protein
VVPPLPAVDVAVLPVAPACPSGVFTVLGGSLLLQPTMAYVQARKGRNELTWRRRGRAIVPWIIPFGDMPCRVCPCRWAAKRRRDRAAKDRANLWTIRPQRKTSRFFAPRTARRAYRARSSAVQPKLWGVADAVAAALRAPRREARPSCRRCKPKHRPHTCTRFRLHRPERC